MDDLDGLRDVCDQFAVGLARIVVSGADFVFSPWRNGNSRDGSAIAAQPRRGVPQISTHHQRVCSLVSEEGESMTTVTDREASHANYLPAAQDQPEKRFWYEPRSEE